MIYIATHKKFAPPKTKEYVPLFCGAAMHDETYGYLRDDSGDNISRKNKNYCELTGLYWLWKNTSDEYVGLVHYRRYFYRRCFRFLRRSKKLLDERFIKKSLKKFDIIVPTPWISPLSLRKQYEDCGFEKDLDIVGEIIKENYPKYFPHFNEVLDGNEMYACNAFVMGGGYSMITVRGCSIYSLKPRNASI